MLNINKFSFIFFLFIIIFFTSCYDFNKEKILQGLNNFGNEAEEFIKLFNKMNISTPKETIEEQFYNMDKLYRELYVLISNNQRKFNNNVINYFRNEYVGNYEKIHNNFNEFIKNDTLSERSFIDKYNNLSLSINEFVISHNNFLLLLEE